MPKQMVNTERLAASGEALRKAKGNIEYAINGTKRYLSPLDDCWQGAASEIAKSKIHSFYNDNKKIGMVLQGYINLIEQTINPNYTDAETTNTKLADYFK